jgi:hypothetical protein
LRPREGFGRAAATGFSAATLQWIRCEEGAKQLFDRTLAYSRRPRNSTVRVVASRGPERRNQPRRVSNDPVVRRDSVSEQKSIAHLTVFDAERH